jgi:excisionase family DNA binding protein
MRAELQSLLDAVQKLSAEQMPELLGELEVVRTTALLKLSAPINAPVQHDELLSVDDAAARLHVSRDYLYRNSSRYPFTRREGRKLLFSSNGIDKYLAQSRR